MLAACAEHEAGGVRARATPERSRAPQRFPTCPGISRTWNSIAPMATAVTPEPAVDVGLHLGGDRRRCRLHRAFVVDVFSRQIFGWNVAHAMRTDFVLDALEQAIHQRQAVKDVRSLGIMATVACSTSRCGTPSGWPTPASRRRSAAAVIRTTNALAESVIGLYRTEVHRSSRSVAEPRGGGTRDAAVDGLVQSSSGCSGSSARSRRRNTRRAIASRPRWPESQKRPSEIPGPIQLDSERFRTPPRYR